MFQSHRPEKFHALREVSFRVQHGESVAVIGHNGAGKSTLLNLTTNLCRPDRGRVEVHGGRVAALLDLGAGFHPDLTGAENVCINAALLGFSRREVRKQFDAIVAFAEIGEFINEPLRTFSSGMIMRLAFSVATSVNPDILIIDEVLGVGDLAFGAKCRDRIMQFRRAGKTILCVSHSNDTLKDLCERAIWLHHGRVMDDGPIARVVEAYKSAMQEHALHSAG
ncbi:MAG: ABC transporter ATP-binding protein [Acidobacteriia bacterium]|nr:ABC transporter ATP-binding protein [Terriglobia bacterium]